MGERGILMEIVQRTSDQTYHQSDVILVISLSEKCLRQSMSIKGCPTNEFKCIPGIAKIFSAFDRIMVEEVSA
jgi:hypothetical protein